jgi:hypothetical protein
VTIPYATADGTATTADNDYLAASGTLTFYPGGPSSQTIAVKVVGDRRFEPAEEVFYVNLGTDPGVVFDIAQGQGVIHDDEPRISISDVSLKEGKEGAQFFVFTVTLAAASDLPVTVNFATADGTATTADKDYVAASGTLTFKPGEVTKTITVKVVGDRKRESDETFLVNLSGAVGATLIDGQGLGTILNDD